MRSEDEEGDGVGVQVARGGLSMKPRQPLTLAHVSDLHLPFEPKLSPAQRVSKRQLSAWSWRRRAALQRPEIVDALAADLRAHAVDHIVVTGDLVNFSLPGEFRAAARWLEALAPADRISVLPGNHDALVAVPEAEGLGAWSAWTRAGDGWPFAHRLGDDIVLIGLDSARPTAPLLARGALGTAQLERLQRVLDEEGKAGRTRIVALHHPAARGAVRWRKALADRDAFGDVLRRAGCELVLHGHARDARLDAVAGPGEPIPVLCVPSSSALPNPKDEGARWHRLCFHGDDGGDAVPRVVVEVRRWSTATNAFEDDGAFDLCLPRRPPRASGQNGAAAG